MLTLIYCMHAPRLLNCISSSTQKLAQSRSAPACYTCKIYENVQRVQGFISVPVTIEGRLDALDPVSSALVATGRMQYSAKNKLFIRDWADKRPEFEECLRGDGEVGAWNRHFLESRRSRSTTTSLDLYSKSTLSPWASCSS